MVLIKSVIRVVRAVDLVRIDSFSLLPTPPVCFLSLVFLFIFPCSDHTWYELFFFDVIIVGLHKFVTDLTFTPIIVELISLTRETCFNLLFLGFSTMFVVITPTVKWIIQLSSSSVSVALFRVSVTSLSIWTLLVSFPFLMSPFTSLIDSLAVLLSRDLFPLLL